MLSVVRRWTASASSYMFVLFPNATMTREWALVGESVSPRAGDGAALVLAGVWIGAFARRLAPGAPPANAARP